MSGTQKSHKCKQLSVTVLKMRTTVTSLHQIKLVSCVEAAWQVNIMLHQEEVSEHRSNFHRGYTGA